MRLTRYTDFVLRTLMTAALRFPARSTVAEVAQWWGIPEPHVRKIVHDLGRAGLLRPIRGRGGGFVLAVEPEQLTVAAIVRRTEPELGPVECLQARGSTCPVQPACVLRTAFAEAVEAFLASLERWTLADLVRPKDRLARLLWVDAEPGGGALAASPQPASGEKVTASEGSL